MAENIVVNGVTYNGVDSVIMQNTDGKSVGFYPDAVRYSEQDLSDEQKQQVIENIGALSKSQLSSAVDEALSKAVSSGEFKGPAGEDGVSATHNWNGTILTVTSASGTSSADLKGAAGADGKDGTSVTVKSVSESTANGGNNVVMFSDGKSITIQNGSKGDKGDSGVYVGTEVPADPSVIVWVNPDGDADGSVRIPVKGVDYWTPADQESIVQDVIRALGTPVFGRVDENNNIILTGALVDGVYTFKYEDADGNVTTIGTLNHTYVPEPTYTNLIPKATTNDGVTIYNGVGYKSGVRWSWSGGGEVTGSGITLSGYIPVAVGDVIRLKNITMNRNESTSANKCNLLYFRTLDDMDGGGNVNKDNFNAISDYKAQWDDDGNLVEFTIPSWFVGTYIRLNTGYIGSDSILTINEEITESGNDMGDSGSIELVWAQGVKLDKNTGAEGTGDGYAASQHIELVDGYTYTFNQNNAYGGVNICYYDANGTGLGYELLWDSKQGTYSKALTPIDGAATFRIRMYGGSDYSNLTPEYFTVTYEKTTESSYTNLIDAVGYLDNTRLSSSSGDTKDQTGYVSTDGLIQLTGEGDVYRTAGVKFIDTDQLSGIWIYHSDKSYWTYTYLAAAGSYDVKAGTAVIDADGNLTFITNDNWQEDGVGKWIRLCGIGSGANLIVTKNQEIA